MVPLKFNIQIAMSTIGNDVAVRGPAIAAMEQDFDIITTHLTVGIREATVDEGPIEIGFAQDNYTAAEIVEALDASPLSQYGTAMERSNRKVRSYGYITVDTTDAELNEGMVVKRKMFLRVAAGQQTGNTFAVNRSGSTLTTGMIVEITGVHWGYWK